jgi:hypothetical protein
VSVLIVIFVLVFAKAAIFYLPMATLASIVIAATLSLFDIQETIFIWRTKKRDFFVLFTAFILTILFGPAYGVLVAVCLNIFLLLLDQYRMKTREVGQMPHLISPTLFDVLHPDIIAEEEVEEERLREKWEGKRISKKLDGPFVIKAHFPEAFTHPHLLIIRPTDSLTYVNIDNWVMHVVREALERLPPQWDLEHSEEMKEAIALQQSINKNNEGNGIENGDDFGHGDENLTFLHPKNVSEQVASHESSSLSSSSSTFDQDSSSPPPPRRIPNGIQKSISTSSSSLHSSAAPSPSKKIEQIHIGQGFDALNGLKRKHVKEEKKKTKKKRPPLSIVSNGQVRIAEEGELHEGEEDKVEIESHRKEIKDYAAKTMKLIGFVIIDMIHMSSMDSIVVGRMRDLCKTLEVNHIALAIARPRANALKYLIPGKFVSLIGQDFVVDSVSTCVTRCNAVLRAAKRFQAKRFLEEEEKNELEEASNTENDKDDQSQHQQEDDEEDENRHEKGKEGSGVEKDDENQSNDHVHHHDIEMQSGMSQEEEEEEEEDGYDEDLKGEAQDEDDFELQKGSFSMIQRDDEDVNREENDDNEDVEELNVHNEGKGAGERKEEDEEDISSSIIIQPIGDENV